MSILQTLSMYRQQIAIINSKLDKAKSQEEKQELITKKQSFKNFIESVERKALA